MTLQAHTHFKYPLCILSRRNQSRVIPWSTYWCYIKDGAVREQKSPCFVLFLTFSITCLYKDYLGCMSCFLGSLMRRSPSGVSMCLWDWNMCMPAHYIRDGENAQRKVETYWVQTCVFVKGELQQGVGVEIFPAWLSMNGKPLYFFNPLNVVDVEAFCDVLAAGLHWINCDEMKLLVVCRLSGSDTSSFRNVFW